MRKKDYRLYFPNHYNQKHPAKAKNKCMVPFPLQLELYYIKSSSNMHFILISSVSLVA